jgi:hypothetical protein
MTDEEGHYDYPVPSSRTGHPHPADRTGGDGRLRYRRHRASSIFDPTTQIVADKRARSRLQATVTQARLSAQGYDVDIWSCRQCSQSDGKRVDHGFAHHYCSVPPVPVRVRVR